MKKVLRHGNKFFIITCGSCQCEFIYQNSDINYVGNGKVYVPRVSCPECNYNNEPTYIKYNEFYNKY